MTQQLRPRWAGPSARGVRDRRLGVSIGSGARTIPQDFLTQAAALLQVVLIDVTLAGDNAVVMGMAVAGLPAGQVNRALLFGIGVATAIRIGLAVVALRLLEVIGLTLAGGLLLLWICTRMFRELRQRPALARGVPSRRKSFAQAILQITLADLSMSLDNVLAVAGAAHEHPMIMAIGLGLSVLLIGVAARALAGALERHRWIAWIGLLVVLYVACRMIWQGSHEVAARLATGPHWLAATRLRIDVAVRAMLDRITRL